MKPEISAVATTKDGRKKIKLPPSVFKTAAEQLRFDAVRSGNLSIDQWSKVQAYASPVCPDEAEPTGEFAFAITLRGDAKAIRILLKPEELQRLGLFVNARLPNEPDAESRFEFNWRGDGDLSVPLAPLRLPILSLNGPSVSQKRCKRTLHVEPVRLLVGHKAIRKFVALYKRSLATATELGGCLIGRMVDLDSTLIEDAVIAEDGSASANEFSYDPHFWLSARKTAEQAGKRVMGWIHSHLCDDGYPRTISYRDLLTCHEFFCSPWFVTALVCVSRHKPDVKWFTWSNGALVEQTDAIEFVGPSHKES